jgi:hypothetical protein
MVQPTRLLVLFLYCFTVFYFIFIITLCYCVSLLFVTVFLLCIVLFIFLYCTVSACDVRAATLTEVFRAFSSVVRQMPGYNSQRLGTARTSQIRRSNLLIVMYFSNFLIVMYVYVPFSVFCVLFVCKCVLYYRHRVSTQLQLNIYHIISSEGHSISRHCVYFEFVAHIARLPAITISTIIHLQTIFLVYICVYKYCKEICLATVIQQ